MIRSWNRMAWGMVASLALTTQGFALGWNNDCCDPCFDPCYDGCLGNIGVGVELLVWKPCIDDLDYAVTTDVAVNAPGTTAVGKSHCLEHDYSPAVRIHLSLPDVWCGWNLKSSYTYFSDKESDSVSGGAGMVHSTIINPEHFAGPLVSAFANHKISYQTWDLLMSYDCCLCDSHQISPFFGLEFVSMDRKINAGANDGATDVRLSWDGDYWGIGFKAGSDYRTPICDCWEFYSTASGTLTTGESCVDNLQVPAAGSVRYKKEECVCVPGWHLGLGFNYSDCWCGQEVTASIGYEYLQWLNTPSMRRFNSDFVNGSGFNGSSNNNGSVGFHGFNFGLAVAF